MKKILLLKILMFLLLSCVNEKDISETKVIKLEHIIDLKEGEELFSIKDYFLRKGKIYIVDNIDFKIKVFDLKGKLLFDFGTEGNGPGEFKRPFSISGINNSIYVNDFARKKIIIFDESGKFFKEFNYNNFKKNCVSLRDFKFVNDSIVFVEEAYFEDKKLCFEKSYNYFDIPSSRVGENIYSVKRYPDYKNFNIFTKNNIELNPKRYEVLKSNKSREKIDFSIINLRLDKERTVKREMNQVAFSEENKNDYYEMKKRNEANSQIQYSNMPKYKYSISDIAIDNKSRIWIASSTKEKNVKILTIFSENGDYLTEVYARNANKFSIYGNYLFCHKLNGNSGSELSIYEIKD